MADKAFVVEVLHGADEVAAPVWDALANPVDRSSGTREFPYNPFLRHAFYHSCEASGSATASTGWMPHHIALKDEDTTIGLLPCYVKSHSQGEYVFDHGWADAFERAGGDYYPKLQAAVPFTPATGRRLLAGADATTQARQALLGKGLAEVCRRLDLSSAHLTFLEESEWKLLDGEGYLRRTDQQFHWCNDGFATFDDFLASLASRKRKAIRKERETALSGNGITIERLTGADLTEAVWDDFFQFYIDTGSRKWGRPYLTRAFFSMIGESMADDVLLVMAKRNGRYVAGAINFVGSHTLYGRHWGCVEHHPCLHFEVCYYQAIDYAIEHGLSRVEAGAQGAHKLARGYLPQTTYSAHFVPNPSFRRAVDEYLTRERDAVAMENAAIERHAPFKRDNDGRMVKRPAG